MGREGEVHMRRWRSTSQRHGGAGIPGEHATAEMPRSRFSDFAKGRSISHPFAICSNSTPLVPTTRRQPGFFNHMILVMGRSLRIHDGGKTSRLKSGLTLVTKGS